MSSAIFRNFSRLPKEEIYTNITEGTQSGHLDFTATPPAEASGVSGAVPTVRKENGVVFMRDRFLPVNHDRLLAAVLAGTRLCRRHEAPFHNLSTTCPDGVRTGRRNRL